MSAVGTTLLQSPGCNEGKARYETLGIHERKVISSSGGAALLREHLSYVSEVPPLWGSINVSNNKPRAHALGYAGVSPLQGFSRFSHILNYFDAVTLLFLTHFHDILLYRCIFVT